MARRFASGNTLTCAIGGANTNRVGTVILLVRAYDAVFDALATNTDFIHGRNNTTSVWAMFLDSGTIFADSDFGSGLAGPSNKDTWYAIAYTKVSGNQAYHYHIAPVGGAWTHGTSGNAANGSGATNVLFGQGPTKGAALFDIAAAATFSTAMSDAAVEALGTTSMATWMAATPTAAWQFNQASTATAVTDLTGGGANQTAISGTTVVADPAGWTYYSAGGSTVNADGTLTVTAGRTGAAALDLSTSGSLAITTGLTAVAAATANCSGNRSTTVAVTGDAAVSGPVNAAGNLAITATRTGAAALDRAVSGTLTVTATPTGAADIQGQQNFDGTRPITATLAGAVSYTAATTGVRAVNTTITGAAAVVRSASGNLALTATFGSTTFLGQQLGSGPRATTSTRTGRHTSTSAGRRSQSTTTGRR